MTCTPWILSDSRGLYNASKPARAALVQWAPFRCVSQHALA